LAVVSSAAFAQKPKETPGAVPALPSDVPAHAERYSVVTMGNLAGQQAIWTADDGTHMFFQFNDRGRGPKITSILKLDSNGIPTAETVKGNDYLKSPVEETYSLENGTARWKNGSEQGDKKLSAPSIYVPINSAPAEQALMVHAALKNGGKVALLPEGEASVTRATALDVESSGRKKHVIMYAVSGLDFSPTYVWLDDKDTYFASVSPWGSVIAEGWEATAKTLQDAQDQVENSRAEDLASKLAHHAEHGIALTHANVFDAETATIVKDQTVVVSGNRIRAVGSSKDIKTPAGAEVVDATGKTLLPGLWDMHAHVGDNDGLLNLAAGVTTVRDLANDTDTLLARRKRIEEGKEIGTRIVIAGIIDGPGPYQGPTKVLVATEQEARAAVDNYKKLGYVQTKIYSSVKPSLVPAIIDESHKNGMRVSGHIPAQMTAAQCVKLGYDEIQHANFLLLNFMPDVEDTNTTKRFTEVAKRGYDVDLNSPEVQSFVKLLLDHHTTLDPTLSVFEDMFTAGSGKIPRGYQPVANRLPAQVRRSLLSAGLTPPAGMSERYNQAFDKMLDMVGMLFRAGIPIEAGTDNMAGFALHRELELDVKAGIPPEKVLQNATLNAARIMSRDSDLGSVTSGKLADMTLVDGDPAEHISDIRKTSLVIKDGVIYKPAELYTALGVTP
jgi:imidazolonepropionase-like amidohydrolase